MELSFLIYTFLRAHEDNKVLVKMTGSRRLKNGLVFPGSFQARTTSLAIAKKFEEEMLNLKELCSHMDLTVKPIIRRPCCL